MFNAEEFLQQSVEGSLDTKIDPLPEDDYRAVIDDIDARAGEKDGKSWTMLMVKWKITDEEKLAAANRTGATISQTIMLDMTDGKLDTGPQKNVGLGRLRDALGQNDGSPWSFAMLLGQAAIVRVGHRPDKNDPEVIYNDVKRVVGLS